MKDQARVRARAVNGKVEIELSNGTVSPDLRSEGRRYEAIEPQEAVALIEQIASAHRRALAQQAR